MDDSSTERAINLVEPLETIVAEADLIVHATVVAADAAPATDDDVYAAQTAVVRVDEVLKGDAPAGELGIVKPASVYYLTAATDDPSSAAEHAGLFVLREGAGGTPELFGYLGVHDDRERAEFDRLLAGLTRSVPTPTDDDIRALAERADAVVAGPAVAEGPIDFRRGATEFTATAVVDVRDVLQGDVAAGELRVVRGRAVFEVGARWGFPTDIPNLGVFFLDTSSEPAVVLNPVDPFRYRAAVVARVLGS